MHEIIVIASFNQHMNHEIEPHFLVTHTFLFEEKKKVRHLNKLLSWPIFSTTSTTSYSRIQFNCSYAKLLGVELILTSEVKNKTNLHIRCRILLIVWDFGPRRTISHHTKVF